MIMPSYCDVVKCNKNASKHDGIRFFRITSAVGKNRKVCEISQRRQTAWIQAMKRKDWSDNLTKYGRVCARHFHSGEPASLRDETHPDWVPSIHMGYEINHGNSHDRCDRYERLQKRLQNVTLPTSLRDGSNTSEAENLESEKETLEYNLQKAKEEIGKLRDELNCLKTDTQITKYDSFI